MQAPITAVPELTIGYINSLLVDASIFQVGQKSMIALRAFKDENKDSVGPLEKEKLERLIEIFSARNKKMELEGRFYEAPKTSWRFNFTDHVFKQLGPVLYNAAAKADVSPGFRMSICQRFKLSAVSTDADKAAIQPYVNMIADLIRNIGASAHNNPTNQKLALPFIPQVLQLLMVGSEDQEDQKVMAAYTLANIAVNNPDTQTAIAANPQAIPGLVALLYSSNVVQQEAAGKALICLAENHFANQTIIGKTSAIQRLVTLLNPKSIESVTYAINVLAALAESNFENQRVIIAAGAIPQLMKLLSNGSSLKEIIEPSVQILRAITYYSSHKATIVANGGISVLISLLEKTGILFLDPIDNIAGALGNLAYDSPVNRVAIAAAGAIPLLVGALSNQALSSKPQHQTILALVSLAYNPDNRVAIAYAGAIPLLVDVLRDKDLSPKTQEHTLRVLALLAYDSPDNQVAIAAAGAIPLLVGVLSNQNLSPKAQRQTILALANLALNNLANQVAIAAEGAIPLLVGVLRDKNVSPKTQENTLLAFALLAYNPSNRVAIAYEGAIPLLVGVLRDKDVSPKTQEYTLMVLALLAYNPDSQAAQAAQAKIAEAEAIPLLVGLLENRALSQQAKEYIIAALANLAVKNLANQAAIAKARAIPLLVDLLESRALSQQAKEYIMAALANLACNSNNLVAIATARAIPLLVGVLSNQALSPKTQEYTMAVLELLAYDNRDNLSEILSISIAGLKFGMIFDCARFQKNVLVTLKSIALAFSAEQKSRFIMAINDPNSLAHQILLNKAHGESTVSNQLDPVDAIVAQFKSDLASHHLPQQAVFLMHNGLETPEPGNSHSCF